MNIQDRRGSLTAEELRQKYNLDALIKDRKAIEQTANTIVKINNEQNNMIEAVILSLSGIELQDNISLWFNNGIPTLENIPSINWEDNETKNDHIGDLYYNRETGFVYQFNYINEEYIWNQVNEPRLIQAMALTNAAVDVADNERKVFLATPKPPYSNGDWYIKENGDLYICQLSKDIEELYNEYDFIVASKYALGTLAAESNNKIVIMAGQVTTIIESVSEIQQTVEDNKYYIDENGDKHLISTATSILKQDVGVIQNEVNAISNIVTDFIRDATDTGNFIKLENTPLSNGAINKLSIKGFELMPLYPGMTYPSEYTFPGVLSFYTLIFDTVSTFDNEPNYVFINSPIPLQKLGNVNDEILIEANKVKVIQRIGYDDVNEEWSVLSNPITHELNDVLLPTFDGDTFVSVKYFDNLIYDAEYLIKNDLTSNFATQIESSSQFKISQDEIEAKVNKDGIISSINLSSEEAKIESSKLAKIKAPQIELEGLVTANENFKILLDGSIEANKGTFKGDIYLPDGGRVIGGDGILGSMQFASFGQFDGFSWLGYSPDTYNPGYVYKKIDIPIVYSIPNNFTPIFAFVTIQHTPITWGDLDMSDKIGNSRNIQLYKANNNTAPKYYMMYASSYEILTDNLSGTEIPSAFGASGFNGERTIGYVNTQVSSNIVNNITEKNGTLFLRTADSILQNNTYCIERTGMAKATLFLIGYTSVS